MVYCYLCAPGTVKICCFDIKLFQSDGTQSLLLHFHKAAQWGIGVTAVLRYACVRTKGGVTLWMDLVTVHQDGWETTAIFVRSSI